MIAKAYTVADPWSMMVHPQNAHISKITVFCPRRTYIVAFLTISKGSLACQFFEPFVHAFFATGFRTSWGLLGFDERLRLDISRGVVAVVLATVGTVGRRKDIVDVFFIFVHSVNSLLKQFWALKFEASRDISWIISIRTK